MSGLKEAGRISYFAFTHIILSAKFDLPWISNRKFFPIGFQ